MTLQANEAPRPDAQPETKTTAAHFPRWSPGPPRQLVEPQRAFAAGLRHHHLANTAYPIAHRKTIWSYRQQRERYREILREAFSATHRLGLYAHYPFCEKRCRFCEYTVVRDHDDASEARYCDALLGELKAYRALLGPKEIVGLDLGGGTPALVSPARLEAFVEQVRQLFELGDHFSISIETTPPLAARDP